MGYLVRERRLLLSGDAVTPCMCLFFPESLPIATWRQTLEKMQGLPFDSFRIGHYSHEFRKSDLDGFLAAADYALSARGLSWMYTYIEGLKGSLYISPDTPTDDADSPDFRAVIGPYVPCEHKRRRRRGTNGVSDARRYVIAISRIKVALRRRFGAGGLISYRFPSIAAARASFSRTKAHFCSSSAGT